MPYPNILSGKDGDFHIFSNMGGRLGTAGQRELLGPHSQKISRLDWHGVGGGIRMEASEGTK